MTLIETEFERESRIRSSLGRTARDYEDEMPISASNMSSANTYTRSTPSRSNSAMFEGGDIAAGILAAGMMLGPLVAYAVGLGA